MFANQAQSIYSTGHRFITSLLNIGHVNEATELSEKALRAVEKTENRYGQAIFYISLSCVQKFRGQLSNSQNSCEKARKIMKEIDCKPGEAAALRHLGDVYAELSLYDKSLKCNQKAQKIFRDFSLRIGEIGCLFGIGAVYRDRGHYKEAYSCFEESLAISKELGNEEYIGKSHLIIASACIALEKYQLAIEHAEKSLSIGGNYREQRSCLDSIGQAYRCQGKYEESLKFHNKALKIAENINDKIGEAKCYKSLGEIHHFRCAYNTSIDYYEKGLKISQESGMRRYEGIFCGNLGSAHYMMGRYDKSIACYEWSLKISKELKDRQGEEAAHCNLGCVYFALGKYSESLNYLQNGLSICRETCSGQGEGTYMRNIGCLYHALGQYDKAIEHFENGLKISVKTQDKDGEGTCHDGLGRSYRMMGQLSKSMKHHRKSLQIAESIGDKNGKAASLSHLGLLYTADGQYEEAVRKHEKSLEICQEIGNKMGEGACLFNLGVVHALLGQWDKSYSYQHKGLSVFKQLQAREFQRSAMHSLGFCNALQGNFHAANFFTMSAIRVQEELREYLSDEHKLSLDDLDVSKVLYKTLVLIMILQGDATTALLIAEEGRARALADLMSIQYAIPNVFNMTRQSTVRDLTNFFLQESKNFLFMVFLDELSCWFVDKEAQVTFRKVPQNDLCIESRAERSSESTFDLQKLYKAIVTPFSDLIDEGSEIIIVPEGWLFLVPFAALKDENGTYLSETVRIRLIPSIATLKLIHDSPMDYHCNTGALIVGDPKVGLVEINGNVEELPPLPSAREEVGVISRLLGVECLVGEQATKEEVLRRIREVCLVHIAAHGNAEKGEIALAPKRSVTGMPKKEDFMLTIKEIAQASIRAKLVVLSCCHSARGTILTAEGVVGIARAFLGSGARSVLISLSEIDDSATKTFMESFYKCLVHKKMSASEALHRTQNDMRTTLGFKDEKDWASFVLHGDDITLDIDEIVSTFLFFSPFLRLGLEFINVVTYPHSGRSGR